MKIIKILPIITIALLAACWSFSYAETEPDNDDLNLDSAFQAFDKEYESHNCRNRPENLKLKAAKDSLEQAIFPVLLTDKNISGCGFDHDVSSCKVLYHSQNPKPSCWRYGKCEHHTYGHLYPQYSHNKYFLRDGFVCL